MSCFPPLSRNIRIHATCTPAPSRPSKQRLGGTAEMGSTHGGVSEQLRVMEEHLGRNLCARRCVRLQPGPQCAGLYAGADPVVRTNRPRLSRPRAASRRSVTVWVIAPWAARRSLKCRLIATTPPRTLKREQPHHPWAAIRTMPSATPAGFQRLFSSRRVTPLIGPKKGAAGDRAARQG